MNSQVFLLVNIAIGVIFVVLFLWRKGIAKPSKLNLKAEAKAKIQAKHDRHVMSKEARRASLDPGSNIRDLNVKFIYNGHDWDAYEVLGLPAGSSTPQAQAAFDRAAANADQETRDFLNLALTAIKMTK